jgi:hypothetical protein
MTNKPTSVIKQTHETKATALLQRDRQHLSRMKQQTFSRFQPEELLDESV